MEFEQKIGDLILDRNENFHFLFILTYSLRWWYRQAIQAQCHSNSLFSRPKDPKYGKYGLNFRSKKNVDNITLCEIWKAVEIVKAVWFVDVEFVFNFSLHYRWSMLELELSHNIECTIFGEACISTQISPQGVWLARWLGRDAQVDVSIASVKTLSQVHVNIPSFFVDFDTSAVILGFRGHEKGKIINADEKRKFLFNRRSLLEHIHRCHVSIF